ncbi:hypothetical protein [Pigmentiphaga sp. D-2]|uniref:hypothetical protein n=1 Tax=Pigmentiphaga sp. D-2 TaxID=1002116 RepID=UPI00104F9C03|nr:hypothetical protein [Pigmentiphaga sp. D-2]
MSRTIDVSTIRHLPVPAEHAFDACLAAIAQRRAVGQERDQGAYLIVDRPYCVAFEWHAANAARADVVTVALIDADPGCKIKVTQQLDVEHASDAERVRKDWARMLGGMSRALRARACA